MYFQSEKNASLEAHLSQCKLALAELSDVLSRQVSDDIVISSQATVYGKVPRDGTIYRIVEGTLKCLRGERVLYYLEEGDCLGFEGSAFDPELDFFAEFAVVIRKIDPAVLVGDNESLAAWARYQGGFIGALMSRDTAGQGETLFSPEIKTIEAGMEIVVQGSEGDSVYSLIDGIAEIEVDGKVVGEILPEQLFGAISVLTKSARFATVRALTDCLIVVLSKEQFESMSKTKPEMLIRLAEDLSRAIITLKEEAGLVGIAG